MMSPQEIKAEYWKRLEEINAMDDLEVLKQRVKRLEDELQIAYSLADDMYVAISYCKYEDMFKAAEEYYGWLHAGEIAAEDINDL